MTTKNIYDNVAVKGTLDVGSADTKLYSGTGSPEGAVTANVGSMWFRTDGVPGGTLYVKQLGTGNTGWAAVGGASAAAPVTLTSTVTASSTSTETAVISTTIPANTLQAGSTYKLTAYAMMGTKAAAVGTFDLNLYAGSATPKGGTNHNLGPTMVASSASRGAKFEALLTCRSTGATGHVWQQIQADFAISLVANGHSAVAATDCTVDTTAAWLWELYVKWGTSDVANTFVCNHATIELVKP